MLGQCSTVLGVKRGEAGIALASLMAAPMLLSPVMLLCLKIPKASDGHDQKPKLCSCIHDGQQDR